MTDRDEIDSAIPPSGSGCVECLASGGWWFHLRRCAHCGHIGCCDSSPSQHASGHAAGGRHPVVQSVSRRSDGERRLPGGLAGTEVALRGTG